MKNKQEALGQYFTKIEIVERLLDLLFTYKKYSNQIKVLEPSFGTGNFIKTLKKGGVKDIEGCEIDREFTKTPSDFFNLPLKNKYDLIVGNPPFSKYNIKESFYLKDKYDESPCHPSWYLTKKEVKKNKEKIENIFILKSLKHLKGNDSSIGFVLPISFFIKNRNKAIKNEVLKYFSTIIVYQNEQSWFDRHIPCCFAIFTNIKKLKDRVILIFENHIKNEEYFSIKNIHEELIPQVIFHKNNGIIKNEKGTPLKQFLDASIIRAKKSYKENNISASNILEKTKIPKNKTANAYKIAVVRVGNTSVGKCGLINIDEDVLNDMFYVFDVKDEFKKNGQMKEIICERINQNLDYFKNITCRVGSKSIKKEDVYNFKVDIRA